MRRQTVLAIATLGLMGIGLAGPPGATADGGTPPPVTGGIYAPNALALPADAAACQNYGAGRNFCMWKDAGYQNTMWVWNLNINPNNTWLYVGAARNDQASSLYNYRANVTYVARDNPVGSGPTACILNFYAIPDLNQVFWPNTTMLMGDSISSVDLLNNATQC